MQNNEIKDIFQKEVKFVLYDKSDKEFTEVNTKNERNEYFVLWYDAKMKNYISFIEYLNKKKIVAAQITPILIVDK